MKNRVVLVEREPRTGTIKELDLMVISEALNRNLLRRDITFRMEFSEGAALIDASLDVGAPFRGLYSSKRVRLRAMVVDEVARDYETGEELAAALAKVRRVVREDMQKINDSGNTSVPTESTVTLATTPRRARIAKWIDEFLSEGTDAQPRHND